MKEIVITLNDGTEVELNEVWNCCDGANDCGSQVEVYETETNDLLATYDGSLPDFDDEDFDMDAFIDKVSEIVDNY